MDWWLGDDELLIHRFPRYDPREHGHQVPESEIEGGDDKRRLCVSSEWVKHIAGVLQRLERADAWTGTSEDIQRAISNVERMLVQLGQPHDDCIDVETITVIETVIETVVEYIGGCAGIEDDMGCVSIPDLIKIENGVLYGRNSCCEWVEIGPIGSSVSEPIVEVPYDDPTTPYSACGKASSLIDTAAAIVQTAIDNRSNIAGWEYALRSAAPGVTLGRTEIWALLPQLAILDGGVSESQIINDDLVQEAKCKAWPGMDTSTGAGTDDEVTYVFNSIKSAIASQNSPASTTLIWGVWERVGTMIGSNDRKLLLSMGAQDFDADCACPDEDVLPVWLEYDDWYAVLDFRNNLPLGITLATSNGNTIITSRGAEVEADTAGSEVCGIAWIPPQLGGVIKRVKVELNMTDAWRADDAFVSLGLTIDGIGNNVENMPGMLVGSGGVYEVEDETLNYTITAGAWEVFAEGEGNTNYDPFFVIIRRIILSGTGPNPYPGAG